MNQFMTSLYNLVTKWQPLVYMLVAICLIGIGVMFVVPSQKAKEFAKANIVWVVIGCGIVLGATVLAQEISGAFQF
ncbi:hypothetical protein [Emergencia sp. 1XD21-10]|uniref:hypothetical protein n=1 Tax=Emergencia sp. 1XD21-10 TaxID=2304569 RepID=UPI00137B87D0|nr:hypothetical protein [Emergencia sp. 1XD21-10]